MLFFLAFGRLVLEVFGVPLSTVRVVGGIILVRIGFSLFQPSENGLVAGSSSPDGKSNIAFVPLAMPLMFGPGALATVIGMSSTVKLDDIGQFVVVAFIAAIVLTMLITYLFLAYANRILRRLGTMGIDAATRIVGFFVSAMGMGLIFHGLVEAVRYYIANVR